MGNEGNPTAFTQGHCNVAVGQHGFETLKLAAVEYVSMAEEWMSIYPIGES